MPGLPLYQSRPENGHGFFTSPEYLADIAIDIDFILEPSYKVGGLAFVAPHADHLVVVVQSERARSGVALGIRPLPEGNGVCMKHEGQYVSDFDNS